MTDVNLLVVQKHTIDSLDRRFSRLGGLVVDETIALRAAVLVCGDLARQHVAEGGEGVVEGLMAVSCL